MSEAKAEAPLDALALRQFQTAVPSVPAGGAAELWPAVRATVRIVGQPLRSVPDGWMLESGVSTIAVLNEAPSRTIQDAAVVRSSPMSSSTRAMIERIDFGRRYDAIEVDLDAVRARLPGLECPPGAVEFLACDDSFEDLSLTVDCLLQHRKSLVAASVDRSRPRRNVLILGAGPGGLMAAIQLRLRDHRVVICEQREVYTRNRFIGVYKQVAHLMAALGMPERMTYDFTHYRGKRGVMLADIQTFLHGIALKLGVIIYTGTVVREMTARALQDGRLELQRSTRGADDARGAGAIGMTRWRYDTVARVRSGVSICFDTIVEATGGRSGLREIVVGRDNVVSLRTIGRDAALRDPSLDSYFDDPEDHCAQFVESDYGCPTAVRREFSLALRDEAGAAIPDELPGLVSNVDASIIVRPIEATTRKPGVGARIGDIDLNIPRDWVLVRCPLPDQTLTRYQIEGPLPASFEFGGRHIPTRECLGAISPVNLLVRLLYAMGVPFDAVDRRRLVEFYTKENSQGDSSDVVAAFVGTFRGLRLGGERPTWCGSVPGSEIGYGIIGEALQNAWYRFGVGVDDTFAGADCFARSLELPPDAREAAARRFEKVMIARSVQVLYHLYLVRQNTEQGVVGPVLTECYMDRRHAADLVEARLRAETRRAMEMAASIVDIWSAGASPLLEVALEHRRALCCRKVFELFRSFGYDPRAIDRAAHAMKLGASEWRRQAFESLEGVLSTAHRELLTLLTRPDLDTGVPMERRSREDRLVELAMGRYDWASPWIRACALRAIDAAAPGGLELFERLASDADPLVAETAAAVLAASRLTGLGSLHTRSSGSLTLDKVLLLKEVSIFGALPHEELVDVATLLSDRWALPGELIVKKGEFGDCLYLVASGAVQVHDDNCTLAQLGPHGFFGELSLLDAETRSASVSATEDTHLLRLEQADFYALVADRPQIVQAINRRLCQIVRGR